MAAEEVSQPAFQLLPYFPLSIPSLLPNDLVQSEQHYIFFLYYKLETPDVPYCKYQCFFMPEGCNPKCMISTSNA